MEEYLNSIQEGLAEMAAYIFEGDTATCKVKSKDHFYKNPINKEHYLEGQIMNYFG